MMNRSALEFDHLPSEDDLKTVLTDESDPRSTAYHRTLIRPKIPWPKIILTSAGIIGLFVALCLVSGKMNWGPGITVTWIVCFWALCGVLLLKKGVITLIKIYQKFAPASIRNKCRFEPSCSEYMILAIEKYGLTKGLQKGIGRLKRCNIHNGGYDDP